MELLRESVRVDWILGVVHMPYNVFVDVAFRSVDLREAFFERFLHNCDGDVG